MQKILLQIFILALIQNLTAQNLVSNGGFEELGTLFFKRGNNRFSMNSLFKSWAQLEFSFPCNCDHKYFLGDYRFEHSDNCILDAPKAYKGCNMSLLWAGIPPENDKLHAAHIYTKLNKTLEIGKIYEISCWFYFSCDTTSESAKEILNHIGCNLTYAESDAMSRNSKSYISDFPYWNLLVQQPILKKWHQQKWYIRPTCELNFLIFGETTDDNWNRLHSNNYNDFKYFIDDVSVYEIDSQHIEKNKIVPINFCKPLAIKKKQSDFEEITILFSNGSAELIDSNKIILDTFAKKFLTNKKYLFKIEGHTDEIGNDNQKLSEKRAEAVKDYFVKTYKLNKFRFITKGWSSKNPATINKDEYARSKNRRVEIKPTEIQLNQVFYSEALKYVEHNDYDSSFYFLNKWAFFENNNQLIFGMFDPRLNSIRKMNKWKPIESKIKNYYTKYKLSEDAIFWDSMYCLDQKYRTLDLLLNNLGIVEDTFIKLIPYLDSIQFSKFEDNLRLKAIEKIEKSGFPKSSEIGERAASAAFLIIQHSDTILMKKYLPIIEQYCRTGEYSWENYAMMYDRIEKIRGNPQLYCTQFQKNTLTNYCSLYNHFPPNIVNEARKKIGLEPLTNFNASFIIKGDDLFKKH